MAALTETAAAVTHSARFSQRVQIEAGRDELGRLATTFNEMLASLERAYQAQQRFVADASHELRAPLTAIRANLELLSRRPNMPEAERAEAVHEAARETNRQVKGALFPGLPIRLTVPKPGWELIQLWARRANQPGAFVLGNLVGLCTLPCSGGICVAVLGLLSARASYSAGLGYLAVYNLAFVLPLAAILLAVGNRPASLGLATWEREHTAGMHLFAGAAMVALRAFMLGHPV